MCLIKKTGLFILLSVFCSLSFSLPVLAEQPMAPIVLDAYSVDKGENRDLYVSGLIEAGLDVLIYIDGNYKGLANISEKVDEINPFSFSVLIKNSKKPYNISVISKNRASSVLSSPTYARDRKVSKPADSKPSLFKGGSSAPAEISSPAKEETTPKQPQAETNGQNLKTATPPPAPTLIGPGPKDVIGTPKPPIFGLTKTGTKIHVYIDGVYNGKTPLLEDKSGTANFAYSPFLNLEVGEHKAWAVAENSEGQKSPVSKTITFIVEDRMVSPTITTNNKTAFTQEEGLSFSGLAKNNSLIKVFIDHLLAGQFSVKNDDSGTANFNYSSPKILKRGDHLVYATAIDKKGKESPWSNIIYFTIYEPQIAKSVTEEEASSTLGVIMEVGEQGENQNENGAETVLKTKDMGTAKGISEEMEEKIENINTLNNFKLNIIIFILFLVAIVVWMLLVNRELVKESLPKEGKND